MNPTDDSTELHSGDTMTTDDLPETSQVGTRKDSATDDLLDSAERIADERLRRKRLMPDRIAYVLRALVERVRTAEAERDEWAMQWRGADDMFAAVKAERDEAQAKLDAVRALTNQPRGFRVHGSYEPVIRTADVLAILDGKTGD